MASSLGTQASCVKTCTVQRTRANVSVLRISPLLCVDVIAKDYDIYITVCYRCPT
jgi:hypothetical protein